MGSASGCRSSASGRQTAFGGLLRAAAAASIASTGGLSAGLKLLTIRHFHSHSQVAHLARTSARLLRCRRRTSRSATIGLIAVAGVGRLLVVVHFVAAAAAVGCAAAASWMIENYESGDGGAEIDFH